MNLSFRAAALSTLLASVAGLSSAQNAVDIGLYQNNGVLEVKVRPESDFSGILSTLVFTIRWDAASEAALSETLLDGPADQLVSITRSGNVRQDGSYKYMVYAGFGMNPLSSRGVTWRAGQEYTIASIPVTGQGEFELVNDAYTADRNNNANFYAACGGSDRTGMIYKGLAPAKEDGSVVIQPNPSNGRFTVSFVNAEKGDVVVEVVNSLGQAVYNETVRQMEGPYRKEMDLTAQSAGAYYVKITRGKETTSHKVIYR